MAEKYCYNKVIMNSFEEKTKIRQDKRIVKHQLFQNYSFWTYIKKNQHIHFSCMVIPLGLHSVYT